MVAPPQTIRRPFRPRARLLQLLGDELIGSARLAVFELVKNAYDADASHALVRIDVRKDRAATITVVDDGEGMTKETLQDVWLVPGDDHRDKERRGLTRSKLHHRLPLGEKGLGRFAVHKLGDHIELITRARGADECVIEISWKKLIAKPFLDEAPVTITVRPPKLFTGKHTGTRITIGALRTEWTRGEVRRLHRQITSVSSPFQAPDAFEARLEVEGGDDWISGLPDVNEILARAIWKYSFRLESGKFDWTYEFRQVPGLKLESRRVAHSGDKLRLPPLAGERRNAGRVVADSSTSEGIGPISGEFYVFDRDREVLRRLPDVQLLTEYLDENGGVRIYRDGMRVYNYGEPGDDWLGLDLRRVNAPTRGVSQNIVLGAVHLSLEHSPALVEKTNREGFKECAATVRLRQVVLGAMAAFESERQIDKERIRSLTGTASDPESSHFQEPIGALKRALKRRGLSKELGKYVVRIEHNYQSMQETLLSAGMSGLNLAVVFHEVERGVRALHHVIVSGHDAEEAARQAQDLMRLLDGFSTLLRRDSQSVHSAAKLIGAIRRFNILRLRHHRVELVAPLLESEEVGFKATFAFGLVVGALNNLVDNALYWMSVRWSDLPPEGSPSPRRLYIDVSDAFDFGPAIIVADTGTGFRGDDPERVVRPFFTRKPSGMGLGLYYASLAMSLNGGQLVFPARGEVRLPEGFDGAVVALLFKRGK